MTRDDLRVRWMQQRDAYERVSAHVNGARIIDAFLRDFDALERDEACDVLTLREAADRSGYSTDHLARLVRQGVIPNAGRRYSPRIRVADLPRRPRRFDGSSRRSYDVMSDARTLGRRRHGDSHGTSTPA
jgi:hypothetical protein